MTYAMWSIARRKTTATCVHNLVTALKIIARIVKSLATKIVITVGVVEKSVITGSRAPNEPVKTRATFVGSVVAMVMARMHVLL